MKLLNLGLSIINFFMSFNTAFLPYNHGCLFESNQIAYVEIQSEGDNYKENIILEVKNGEKIIEIKPIANSGYNPNVFVANFLNNGLMQILYSVESGGSGGYSFYEIYSLDKGCNLIFNSQEFNPTMSAKILDGIAVINYQGNNLYIEISQEQNVSDEIFISPINAILPYYNIALDRFYLQILQPIYVGYRANNIGYIQILLEINYLNYKIINIGTLSNFDYDKFN